MNLSKSKIIAFRQCPKRLWLEINKPEFAQVSAATQASFNVGNQVGEIARAIYDPNENGILIDIKKEGFNQALARSKTLVNADVPIFEAGFSGNGLLAFADVMLPVEQNGKRLWKMVEVKSSTSVKDYHLDDIAVQSYVAQVAGFNLQSVSLAHIDSKWVYPGGNNYVGLLAENDLTETALSRHGEVETWVKDAREVLAGEEPDIAVGDQCKTPFDCIFLTYCTRDMMKAEYPISWLPRLSRVKAKKLEDMGIIDLKEVPDAMLNKTQKRVKQHTLERTTYFDFDATSQILNEQQIPAYFLDFETINFAVPIWAGTRPYEQVTFQFSLHVMQAKDDITHSEFLDISGNDPSRSLSEMLIKSCGKQGPVYVYNAGFEGARIKELAARFPDLAQSLKNIAARLFDLLPLAKAHFYHPSQQGSWSIKKVLPALVPELDYANLDGVKDGGMAMEAFAEAIHPSTLHDRKMEIQQQLLAYCKQDTWAMVKIFQAFTEKP
jgi:hypothetical protein